MADNLYKFKLISYGKSEGLKHAKQFIPGGATKKIEKLDKEIEFYKRLTHEVWSFEANELDDNDIDNLLEEWGND